MVRMVLQYRIVRPTMCSSNRPNIAAGKDVDRFRNKDFRVAPRRLGDDPLEALPWWRGE